MLSAAYREKLAVDISRNAYEASTLNDLAGILPLFDKLFDTSLSILYQCNDRGDPIGVGGASEVHRIYLERYFVSDPMRDAIQRLNRKILQAARNPEWHVSLKLPLYLDHAKHHGIDDYALVKLTEAIPFNRGMVGLLLARSRKCAGFDEQDWILMARLLPPLEALVRRSARVEKLLAGHAAMEGMVDLDPRPKIAFDVHGSLLWASDRAEKLIGLRLGARRQVPQALAQAANRLGALAGKEATSGVPLPLVTFPGAKAESIRAELRLARTRSGEAFVLAELEIPDISPQLAEVAARYRLTATETQVLDLLAQGCSDQKIGRRLFVSLATVRTHVGRILSKLGVHSRVQAVLVSYGVRSEAG
ncbi:MAG TPA: LuxR C-terminal-related transcriptional regulator [bacterium]|nr:LuxR C-terminal-related transcriptional regulator [bacterium]